MSVPLLLWLVIGALLIGGELMTGTFYLLIFGVAAWVGAALTFFGFGIDAQLGGSGLAAIAGLIIVTRYGKNWRKTGVEDQDMDVGNEVSVLEIIGPSRIRVQYRGSTWDATVEGGGELRVGELGTIREVRGNALVVAPVTRH